MLEPLAAYELDLIQQSFDAAARLYPVFKGVPVAELIKQRNPERASPGYRVNANGTRSRSCTQFFLAKGLEQ